MTNVKNLQNKNKTKKIFFLKKNNNASVNEKLPRCYTLNFEQDKNNKKESLPIVS